MEKIKARFKEPSTYAGIAALVYGAGELFKLDHASEVSSLVAKSGAAFAAGDVTTGGVLVLSGLLAIFLKEQGSK